MLDKPDHYSLMTAIMSVMLGILNQVNDFAQDYMPLISFIGITFSMSMTFWYYRARIHQLKRVTQLNEQSKKEF